MSSNNDYAVRPAQGDVANLPGVNPAADRLLDRTPRRGGKKNPRRQPGAAAPSSGGSSGPSTAAAPADKPPPVANGGDGEHVDYLI
jgi:hypothetical protein